MAAFVNYSTRDNGVLSYRGFEQALMNDPHIKRMITLASEFASRYYSPFIDVIELESALRNKDVYELATILGLSIDDFNKKSNDLVSSAIYVRDCYGNILKQQTRMWVSYKGDEIIDKLIASIKEYHTNPSNLIPSPPNPNKPTSRRPVPNPNPVNYWVLYSVSWVYEHCNIFWLLSCLTLTTVGGVAAGPVAGTILVGGGAAYCFHAECK